jgi:trans-2-enoyl-CoA reductase
MLKDFGDLRPGDTVLQNGANSAVGLNVIQLAKAWGLKTLNVIRTRPEPGLTQLVDTLKGLGADHVVLEEDLRKPEHMEKVMKDTPKAKLALNCVGGKNATDCMRFMAPKGVMVTYGGMSKQPLIIPTGALIFRDQRFLGFWNTGWTAEPSNASARSQMLQDICDLYRAGTLQAPKVIPFRLDQYQEALDKATSGFVEGKVAFVPE